MEKLLEKSNKKYWLLKLNENCNFPWDSILLGFWLQKNSFPSAMKLICQRMRISQDLTRNKTNFLNQGSFKNLFECEELYLIFGWPQLFTVKLRYQAKLLAIQSILWFQMFDFLNKIKPFLRCFYLTIFGFRPWLNFCSRVFARFYFDKSDVPSSNKI